MDVETRFSLFRWLMPVAIAFYVASVYSNLQAYLLRHYEPSAEYVNQGWTVWYYGLITGALLIVSLNILCARAKNAFGTERSIQIFGKFTFLISIISMILSNYRDFDTSTQFGFYSFPQNILFILLAVTIISHIGISLFNRKNATLD